MKLALLYIMALIYIGAGIFHFVRPEFYQKIMPPYLPYHAQLISISGACEIFFGLLLLPNSTRKTAAWLLIALLIAVFPANIQMFLDFKQQQHEYLWAATARLPLQLVFIAWAYWYTKNND